MTFAKYVTSIFPSCHLPAPLDADNQVKVVAFAQCCKETALTFSFCNPGMCGGVAWGKTGRKALENQEFTVLIRKILFHSKLYFIFTRLFYYKPKLGEANAMNIRKSYLQTDRWLEKILNTRISEHLFF